VLLIGMPKSATTSLIYTLREITGKQIMAGVPGKIENTPSPGFPELQKYHNNMVRRSELWIKQVMSGRETIFKEHLLPTDDHLQSLGNSRKSIVILLRDPQHVLDAYRRRSEQYFINHGRRMDLNQLEKDLHDLHDRYMWWESNKPFATLIYYRDLVLNYKQTMRRILLRFKLKAVNGLIPLKKKKYTGVGVERLC